MHIIYMYLWKFHIQANLLLAHSVVATKNIQQDFRTTKQLCILRNDSKNSLEC